MKENDPTGTDLLAALDFPVMCDVGHPGGYGEGIQDPCTKPADWTIHYHACSRRAGEPPRLIGHGVGPWCSDHLGHIVLHAQRITGAPGLHRCICGRKFQSTSDLIWGLKRLTPRETE